MGDKCRNKSTCRFTHPNSSMDRSTASDRGQAPSNPSSSYVAFAPGNLCRAGASCKRPNCKFDHPAPSATDPAAPVSNLESSYSRSSTRHDAASDSAFSSQSAPNEFTISDRTAKRSAAKYPIYGLYSEFCSELISNGLVYLRSLAANCDVTQIPQYAQEATNARILVVCPDTTMASFIQTRIAFEFDGCSPAHSKRTAMHSSSKPLAMAHIPSTQIVTVSARDMIAISHNSSWMSQFGVAVVLEVHSRKIEIDTALVILQHLRVFNPLKSDTALRLVLLSADDSDAPVRAFFGFPRLLEVAPQRSSASAPPVVEFNDLLYVDSRGKAALAAQKDDAGDDTSETGDDQSDAPSTVSSAQSSFSTGSSSRRDDSLLTSIASVAIARITAFLQGSANGSVIVLSGSTKHAKTLEEALNASSIGRQIPSYALTTSTDFKLINKLVTSRASDRFVVVVSEWAECFIPLSNISLVIDTGLTATIGADGSTVDTLVPKAAAQRRIALCDGRDPTYVSLYTPSAEKAEVNCTLSEFSSITLQLIHAHVPVAFIDPPPQDILAAAEQMLIGSGCVVQVQADQSHPSDPNAPSAPQFELSELGARCMVVGAVDVRWASLALRVAELSFDLSLAASILAVFSHGYSLYERGSDSAEFKSRLAEASLSKKNTESDILHTLHHFTRWLKSSFDERRDLAKDQGLKISTLDRMTQLYDKHLEALRVLFPVAPSDHMQMDLMEVIGKAFAQSFPDKIAEYLLPGLPEAGIFFPLNGVLSRLSLNSALAIPQGSALTSSLVFCLHVTSHEGQYQANMCHPLSFDWLPTELQQEITQRLQKFSSCFYQANLHHSAKDSVISGLKADSQRRLIHIAYDPSRLLLTAYCPQALVEETRPVIQALVSAHIASLTEAERDVMVNPERTVTIRSGFFVTNTNTGDRKVDFEAPGFVTTPTELVEWAADIAKVSSTDIVYSYFNKSRPSRSLTASTASTASTTRSGRPCTVLFKNDAAAKILRSHLIQARASSALDGARLALDSRNQQQYCVEISFTKELEAAARLAIEQNFSGSNTEVAQPLPDQDSQSITRVAVYSTSQSQAQAILDSYPSAACTQTVSVPHRLADLYKPALTALTSSMRSIMLNSHFEQGHSSIRISGNSVREVSKASRSLSLALAPSHLNLTGAWRMFYTEWAKLRLQLKATNVRLEVTMGSSRSGLFATAASLYGSQVDQAAAIVEIAQMFAKFRCEEVDVSMAKMQFTQTRAGGAELAKHFLTSDGAKFMRHRVDITSGTIFVFVPLPNPAKPPTNNKKYDVSDATFRRICSEVSALAAKYNTSAHSHSEHAAAPAKCGFCGDSDPDTESSLCGHRFCTGCLVKEASNALGPISCKHCQQVIPIRHFPQLSMLQILSASLATTLKSISGDNPMASTQQPATASLLTEHLALAQQISFCPNAECDRSGDRPANGKSYGKCEDCGILACSLCGVKNQQGHDGCGCEEFKQKLLNGDVKKHLEALFVPAEAFADSVVDVTLGKVVERIRNPLLERGCPAMLRFVRGLSSKGGVNILSRVKFAWHGTNIAAIPLICQNGFDPSRRSGQVYGTGEYFGFTASTSSGYAKPGDCSHVMILAALMDVMELSINSRGTPFCYIVNNPRGWRETYCLPLLIIRFSGTSYHRKMGLSPGISFDMATAPVVFSFMGQIDDQTTLGGSSSSSSSNSGAIWRWKGDNGPQLYTGYVAGLLEAAYTSWISGTATSSLYDFTTTRALDGAQGSYQVDFQTMVQTNVVTSYRRKIERAVRS